MLIPKNEGNACDAVVRHIGLSTGEKRSCLRLPKKDGDGPPVDLRLKVGERDYAIEHTLLQPHENRMKDGAAFRKISKFIRGQIREPLPGQAYYELHIPIHITLPKGKKKRDKAFADLADWIRNTAKQLHEGAGGPRLHASSTTPSRKCRRASRTLSSYCDGRTKLLRSDP